MTARRAQSRWYYPTLALAVSATVYWGFYYTYFGPVLAGQYPGVSAAIHVHGWSFFLWFVLFPLQAVLMAAGRRRLHFALGSVSVALAAVMTFTGLLVASVRIDQGLADPTPDEFTTFWKDFGLLITYSLVLFVAFYAAAIAKRKQPESHKRLMIIASASAIPAAVFRIIVGLGGFHWLATPAWVMQAAFFPAQPVHRGRYDLRPDRLRQNPPSLRGRPGHCRRFPSTGTGFGGDHVRRGDLPGRGAVRAALWIPLLIPR